VGVPARGSFFGLRVFVSLVRQIMLIGLMGVAGVVLWFRGAVGLGVSEERRVLGFGAVIDGFFSAGLGASVRFNVFETAGGDDVVAKAGGMDVNVVCACKARSGGAGVATVSPGAITCV